MLTLDNQGSHLDHDGLRVTNCGHDCVDLPFGSSHFFYCHRPGNIFLHANADLEVWPRTKYIRGREFGVECLGSEFHSRGAMVVSVAGYKGIPLVGGPVESTGRTKLADGSSETAIVPPIRRGDPRLDFVHIPPNIDQLVSVHNSPRVGTVVRGSGTYHAPGAPGQILKTGDIWITPAGEPYWFETNAERSLELVVFQPGGYFGEAAQVIASTAA